MATGTGAAFDAEMIKRMVPVQRAGTPDEVPQFAEPGAPKMDFVFTVCDNAAGEVCPVWPGQPMTAHWGVADPSAFDGTPAQQAKVFLDTALVLKRRIELMLALPLATLDSLAIQREIDAIGGR